MTATTPNNTHHKFLAVFPEPYASGIPATITNAIRVNDDMDYQDDSTPVARDNVAGAKYTRRKQLPGRLDASGTIPFNLAPALAADGLSSVLEIFKASGINNTKLTLLPVSGISGLAIGDQVDNAAATPTASGIVSLIKAGQVFIAVVAGAFTNGDTLFIDGTTTSITVTSAPTVAAGWEFYLDSTLKHQIAAFFFKERSVKALRKASTGWTLSAGGSSEVVTMAVEISGTSDHSNDDEVDEFPAVTYECSENDLQLRTATLKITPTAVAGVTMDFAGKGYRSLEVSHSPRRPYLPDATQSAGSRGSVVNGRDTLDLKVTIDSPLLDAWDTAKARAEQAEYTIETSVQDLLYIYATGQISGLTYGDDNGFATDEITFKIGNNADSDNEFRMVFLAE